MAFVGFIAKAADFKQAPGVGKDEILLHEMVHGLRQLRGTTDSHKPADAPNMDTVEEFMAIVVSNVYRSELNRPGLRADHHGFAPLPGARGSGGIPESIRRQRREQPVAHAAVQA